MNVHQLPPSQHRAGIPVVLPNLFVVRGATAENHRTDADHSRPISTQAAQGAGRLGGAWTQRAGLARAGEGADTVRADWPGCAAGIRAPEEGETPLNAAEVLHALKIKLIADDNDEIDKWPAVRIRRPAGAWVSAAPGAPRARWFDAVVTA
jgi:hypothetical protein